VRNAGKTEVLRKQTRNESKKNGRKEIRKEGRKEGRIRSYADKGMNVGETKH